MRVRLGMMIVTALLSTPVASQAQGLAGGTDRGNDDGAVASGQIDGSSVGTSIASDMSQDGGAHQDFQAG